MAEAVGLVVGFVSLAGLFSTCVDCFGWVQLYRSHGDDFNTYQTMLDNQQFLLMAWGKACGFMDQETPNHLFNNHDSLSATRNKRIKQTLERIQSLLTDAETLRKKYGLREHTLGQLESSYPSAFSKAFQRTKKFWDTSLQRKSRFTAKLLWVVGNAEKFESLVDHLRSLIEDLSKFSQDIGTGFSQRLVVDYEIETISDEASLEAISAAGGKDANDDAVSYAARKKLEHIAERTAVSRNLLTPDDSASQVTYERPEIPPSNELTRSRTEFNDSNAVQEIAVQRIPHAEWRKVKTQQGILPWLPIILVSEITTESGNATASFHSADVQTSDAPQGEGDSSKSRLSRIAINSSLLIEILRKITGENLDALHNVLLYPFQLLIAHHQSILSMEQQLNKYLSRGACAEEGDNQTVVFRGGLSHSNLRLRDELACLSGLIETDLLGLVNPQWQSDAPVAFHDLCLLFQPGDTVVRKDSFHYQAFVVAGVAGGTRILENTAKNSSGTASFNWRAQIDFEDIFSELTLLLLSVDYDGARVGPTFTRQRLRPYPGLLRPTSMAVYPVKVLQNSRDVMIGLEDRGMWFLECIRSRCLSHSGPVLDEFDVGHATECVGGCRRFTNPVVEGSVIIDQATAQSHLAEAGCTWRVALDSGDIHSHTKALARESGESFEVIDCSDPFCKDCTDVRSDTEAVVGRTRDVARQHRGLLTPKLPSEIKHESWAGYSFLPYRICGYSLDQHQWYPLNISSLQPCKWDVGMMEKVVLPTAQKDAMRVLVQPRPFTAMEPLTRPAYTKLSRSRGTILLFHGAPGSGKTLTAKAVSEASNRPMLTVSTADLGNPSTDIIATLRRFLDLAARWGLNLVLDDADIFLQQATDRDFARSIQLSNLLKLIEKHTGLLILIYTRVAVLDKRLESMINLAIGFPALCSSMQMQIWELKITQLVEMGVKVHHSVKKLEKVLFSQLSSASTKTMFWNGHQISKAFSSALALAESESPPGWQGSLELRSKHFEVFLEASSEF